MEKLKSKISENSRMKYNEWKMKMKNENENHKLKIKNLIRNVKINYTNYDKIRWWKKKKQSNNLISVVFKNWLEEISWGE